MADDKKTGGTEPSILAWFIVLFGLLFILWIVTGGPERSPESRQNYFIDENFNTYH